MKIVVVGSCSQDYFTIGDRFPKKGETLFGKDFSMSPGGKGSNQAVAAAKLGADVTFLGCVGNDDIGEAITKNMSDHSIKTNYIEKIDGVPTGIATIIVAEEDNIIVIVKGANNAVTVNYVQKNLNVLEDADMVIMQLEIPLETVEFVTDYCYEKGISVILNPAPAIELKQELIEKVTYITPNETELEIVFNDTMENVLQKYPNKVIMTNGSLGVNYHNGKEIVNVPSYKVNVVDTTGAGDSFNGALAYSLLAGNKLSEAIRFSNKVASKTVQDVGAQTAMPKLDELEQEDE